MALESYMEEEFKKHAAHTINDGTQFSNAVSQLKSP